MEDRTKRIIWATGSLILVTGIVAVVLKLLVWTSGIRDFPVWTPVVGIPIGLILGHLYVEAWKRKVDWLGS